MRERNGEGLWWAGPVALLVLMLLAWFFGGCAHIPRIKMPGVGKVSAFKDAGTPAEMSEGTERTGMRIPKNSKVTVTKTEPLPKEGVLLPGKTEWTFELPEPTDFMAEVRNIQASTGTVDTSVAKRRADNEERRILLFIAIGCGVAGLIARALVPAWPSLPNGLFLAAIIAGVSWKVSELPAWLWAVAIAIAVLMIAVYKKAEWDKDGDNIPDFLQKK